MSLQFPAPCTWLLESVCLFAANNKLHQYTAKERSYLSCIRIIIPPGECDSANSKGKQNPLIFSFFFLTTNVWAPHGCEFSCAFYVLHR